MFNRSQMFKLNKALQFQSNEEILFHLKPGMRFIRIYPFECFLEEEIPFNKWNILLNVNKDDINIYFKSYSINEQYYIDDYLGNLQNQIGKAIFTDFKLYSYYFNLLKTFKEKNNEAF